MGAPRHRPGAAAGHVNAAEIGFAEATANSETVLAANPKDMFVRADLVNTLSEWGALRARRGDRTGARTKLERALSIAEALAAEDEETASYRELRETAQRRIDALRRSGRQELARCRRKKSAGRA